MSLVRGAALVAGLLVFAHAPQLAAGQDKDKLPSGKEVIDRHVKAIGGASAHKALKSVKATGKFEMPEQNITGDFEIYQARPAKVVMHVNISGVGRISQGYDGKVGWRLDPMQGPALQTGKELKESADDAWFDGTLHEPDHVKEMTTVAKTEFDSRPAYKVRVVSVSGNEQMEYYDAETGFMIGLEATRQTPMGDLPTTGIFRSYKKFGALMQPTILVQRLMGMEQVLTLTSFEYDTVPANVFELPAEIKALIKY